MSFELVLLACAIAPRTNILISTHVALLVAHIFFAVAVVFLALQPFRVHANNIRTRSGRFCACDGDERYDDDCGDVDDCGDTRHIYFP